MPTAIYDLVHVVFKRKYIVALAVLAVLLPTAVTALLRPTVYRAASRLMVTQARAYPQLTPGEDPRNMPVNDIQFVAATAQTLKARSFLEEAAAAIAGNGHGKSAASPESSEFWMQRLAKYLEVTPLSNAPLIEVAYRADEGERAASVVNVVVDEYVQYQARTVFDHAALGRFYEQQRVSLAEDLEDSEAALLLFQHENDLFELETQRIALTRIHADAIEALDNNAGQIRQSETNAKALSAQLEKLPAQLALHSYGDSPRLSALGAKVVELELKLNDLRQLYTDEDRRVKDTLEELAHAEEMLGSEEASIGDAPTSTRLESNDAYQNILENSLREEASAEALRARREEIERQVQTTAERIEKLNALGSDYARLKAARDAKQASYNHHLVLLERARSSEAMDAAGLTNVRVVDRAAVPTKPLPNHSWLTLAMGLMASLAVGVGGAFTLEALSPTIRGRQDGEQRLALPVLAVIPEDV
jgi:uncharacterized protein involved in exopolysaccharide biosynthesis